jgi:hypothetical protein
MRVFDTDKGLNPAPVKPVISAEVEFAPPRWGPELHFRSIYLTLKRNKL